MHTPPPVNDAKHEEVQTDKYEEVSFIFTTLLLIHSRSAHLLGTFLKYQWRYL